MVSERIFAKVQGPPLLPQAMAGLKTALDKCVRERPPLTETTPPAR